MTEQSKTPLWKRVLRRTGIIAGTTATIGIASVAVVGGTRLIANTPDPASEVTRTDQFVASTAQVVIQDAYMATTAYTGQLEPKRRTTLGFELSGSLAERLVDEGDRVDEGDVLARLDTRSLKAQRQEQEASRAALDAQIELARVTLDRQETLSERNFASVQRFDEARFTLARLQAEQQRLDAAIAATDIQLSKSEIIAPYAGRIGLTHVDDGATVGSGQAILELFEEAAPRFRVGLPADLISALDTETISVTINGETLDVLDARQRGDINPVTRTQTVLFDLPSDADALPSGSLGILAVERSVVGRGAWVESSALSEGIRGLWTLYVVDADGTARREAVEVLHVEGDQSFVNGAFEDNSTYVTSGAHRIAPGQTVAAVGN